MAAVFFRGNVKFFHFLSGYVKFTSGYRSVSYDIGQPTSYSHPHLLKDGEVTPRITKAEFAERRSRFAEELYKTHHGMTNTKHVVLISGAPIRYMCNDIPYKFHQNPNLNYLCGFGEPDCVLLLESSSKGLPSHKAILYVQPKDQFHELWNGVRCGPVGAVEHFGVDEAYEISQLKDDLQSKYASNAYSVWYDAPDCVNHDLHSDIHDGLMTQDSNIISVNSPTEHIHKLRTIKSEAEVDLMRTAGIIASKAFQDAMRNTTPSMTETQLESVFEHRCKMDGAQWLSFPPVVAGGERALSLHYIKNDQLLQESQLVLMDAGCEYHGYVSDITRTWPVNGHFTPAQRALYEAILDVQNKIIKVTKAGETLDHLHHIASNLLTEALKSLGIISNRTGQHTVGRLFPHHVSHYLGLDVHDTMLIDRTNKLLPNMVITCEPAIYIPKDFPVDQPQIANEFRGIGIRIEDNLLITHDSVEVINKDCPKDVKEIESLVGTKCNH
ncbi:xaa-Pro aminopeptidase 3-like [Dysidea avara]|uniref:xaa-Pro aminopeptidase 3-like n=1 Tax=Dysidea avara TaxID=196820 RepID=UPI003321099B